MKKYLIVLALFLFAGIKAKATDDSDSLGLPGDNLDLAGVLDLFKASSSLDDFEKKLNDPTNEVNNLDLNNDQNVDYIRVVDQVSDNAHAIVLQVPINETESQDVAVIEVEKEGTESAQLQISGDEELYGENYFVEPSDDAATTTEQKWQGFRPVVVFVNVWMWPCVRYVYAPTYVIWVSPYRWNYYPNYWHPWHPMMWRMHHEHVMRYHHHCAYVHACRTTRAHAYYGPHRNASPSVHRTYAANHQRHEARTTAKQGNGQNSTQKQNPNQKAGKKQPANGGAKKGNGGQNKGGGAKTGPKAGKQQAPKNGGGNKGGGHGGGGGKKGGGGKHR